jgi:hypothetical protein
MQLVIYSEKDCKRNNDGFNALYSFSLISIHLKTVIPKTATLQGIRKQIQQNTCSKRKMRCDKFAISSASLSLGLNSF